MSYILRARDLRKDYGKRSVLADFCMDIHHGESVALLGPNGSGKSTAFKILNGMVRPDSGSVEFQDRDISRLPTYKRAQMGLGYLSQDPSYFRLLSVHDNLRAILEVFDHDPRSIDFEIERMAAEMGLETVLGQQAYRLSGGERRRLEMAMVLCYSPKLVLLDEPFLGIDPKGIESIRQLILGLRRSNITVVIADHQIREAIALVDRAYVLFEGNCIFEGSAAALKEDELVRERLLGERFNF